MNTSCTSTSHEPKMIEEFLQSLQILKNEYEATSHKLSLCSKEKVSLLEQIQNTLQEKEATGKNLSQLNSKNAELCTKSSHLSWLISCKKNELGLLRKEHLSSLEELKKSTEEYEQERRDMMKELEIQMEEKGKYANYNETIQKLIQKCEKQIMSEELVIKEKGSQLHQAENDSLSPKDKIQELQREISCLALEQTNSQSQYDDSLKTYLEVKKDHGKIRKELTSFSKQHKEAQNRVTSLSRTVSQRKQEQQNNTRQLKDMAITIQQMRRELSQIEEQISFAEQDAALRDVIHSSNNTHSVFYGDVQNTSKSSPVHNSVKSRYSSISHSSRPQPYQPRKEFTVQSAGRFAMRGSMRSVDTPQANHNASTPRLNNRHQDSTPARVYRSGSLTTSDDSATVNDELLDINLVQSITKPGHSTEEENPFSSYSYSSNHQGSSNGPTRKPFKFIPPRK